MSILYFQKRYPVLKIFVLLSFMLQMSCKNHSYPSPENYDLEHPQEFELGKTLNEISGLSFNNDDNNLLAISDSREKIIQISLDKQKLKDKVAKIGNKNDYEDLTKVDKTIFVLISNGTIVAVPANFTDSSRIDTYPFWSTAKNDFETLYYDSTAGGLIMLCKTCADEKGQEVRTAYRFNLSTLSFDSAAFYTISSADVAKALGDDKPDFKPSAAAIHPIDNQLYILSSAGQFMVIADLRGKVKAAYKLDPKLYPQAEGLAFAPDGTMYISNEGKFEKPTLLIFPYGKNGKKKTK